MQTLGGPETFTAEPYVAVHPEDTGIIAVGANRIGAYVGTPSLPPSTSSGPGLTYGLFITEDHGRTWRTPAIPTVPGSIHLGDPSIEFDARGTLHVTGLMRYPDANRSGIFHVSTPDLGESWSPVRELSDDRGGDRQWLSIDGDRVFVAWQVSSIPATFVARSNDRGASWEPVSVIEACNLNSEVVVVGDRALLACTDGTDGSEATRITDVSRHDQPMELARLPVQYGYKRLTNLPDAAIALTTSGNDPDGATVFVRTSSDGGSSWNDAFNAGAASILMDGWSWSWISWATADPDGRIHVLATGGTGDQCVRGACDDERAGRQHVHLIVDASAELLLHEALVSPADPGSGGRGYESAWPGLGDEASGIACHAKGCVLAWGWGKAIDWTTITWS